MVDAAVEKSGASEDKEALETLLRQIRMGEDTDAFTQLCERYAHLLDAMVRQFAPSLGIVAEGGTSELLGIGREELRQDAALALYRAAQTYDPADKGQSVQFGLYAKICIRNAMITLVRRYNRMRTQREKQTGRTQTAPSRRQRWESLDKTALTGETMQRLQGVLSPYEKQILQQYMQGKPPREIAVVLGRSERSVSNGIYRMKGKLKEILAEK